jgi:hypothetical protein
LSGMKENDATPRGREIGLILQRAAKERRMTGADIARWLDWSESKVSRLLNGKHPCTHDDVLAVVTATRLRGEERARALHLAGQVAEPEWVQQFGRRLPPELRTLASYEAAAAGIVDFETSFIPGLLQTPDYARALIRATAAIPADEVDDRIAARMRRRNIMLRSGPKPPDCAFYLDEHAVTRVGPGRGVMCRQVHHLLQTATRSNVQIRIVPERQGFHAGQRPFHLMTFLDLKPVVHLESDTSVQFVQRTETVETYQEISNKLARVALSQGESREWLARVARALGPSREERHDLAEE